MHLEERGMHAAECEYVLFLTEVEGEEEQGKEEEGVLPLHSGLSC